MKCPNCGAKVPKNAGACPKCSAAVITVTVTAKPQWTLADGIIGVLFIAGGVTLLILNFVRLLGSFGPASDVFQNLPAIGGLGELASVTEARFLYAPLVLQAFADLMWTLAGLFMLLGGIGSLTRGRGSSQLGASVIFMLFGLCATFAIRLIIGNDSLALTGLQYQPSWQPVVVQLVLVLATLLLMQLRKSAQKWFTVQANVKKKQLKEAMEQAARQPAKPRRSAPARQAEAANEAAAPEAPPPPPEDPAAPGAPAPPPAAEAEAVAEASPPPIEPESAPTE